MPCAPPVWRRARTAAPRQRARPSAGGASVIHRRLARALALLLAASVGAAAVAADGPEPWDPHLDRIFLRLSAPESTGATAMAQDAQGFLWVGTQAGLLRWDGYQFRSYAPDPGTAGALPDNYVTALHIDTQGRLWVGTSAGGLARYEPGDDSFSVVALPSDRGTDLSITAISADGTGGLWVGTGHGLVHVPADGTKALALHDAALHGEQARVQSLLRDRGGTLWVGTRHGLLRRSAEAASLVAQPVATPQGTQPVIRALFEDSAGRLWIGTQQYGAYTLDAAAPRPQALEAPAELRGLAGDSISTIIEARPHEVWLGTLNSGIVTVDTVTRRVRRERHDGERPTSLPNDGIYCLFRDRKGLIWIGGTGNLGRIDPQQTAIGTVFGSAGAGHLIGDTGVPALLAMPDGRIWLGLDRGGITIIDPAGGRTAATREGAARAGVGALTGEVTALARAGDGGVYIGADSGLYRASADGSSLRRIELQGPATYGSIFALYADGTRLWVGGADGLWELELAAPRGPFVLQHLASELGDARVSVLRGSSGPGLWIGTRSGVVYLNRDTGRVSRLPVDPKDPSTLAGGLVSSLLVDPKGRLWVGVFGRGIQVEDGRGADGRLRFRRLGTRDGLPQNSVDMLLLDRLGAVWASTDEGLARIDPDTLRVRAFRTEQGVGIRSHWIGAGTLSASGTLLFGGTNGMTIVHPERVAPVAARPALTITEARASGRPISPGLLSSNAPLQVDAAERSLMVEFSTLDFDDPEHESYRYRLVGFDNDWIASPSSRRLASYTNLPPGDYTLQLSVPGADGNWLPPLERAVHVEAAWYQRSSVRAGAIGIAVLLFVGLVQLRTLYLRQRQQELQRLVAERTAELERRSAELHRSREQLEKMAYFDSLTGLPNRRMFNDDMRRLISRSMRGHGHFALLLVDLDGFKQVNDVDGHDAGDALLVAVAERLKALVRDSDHVARLGGDEFAVLLPTSDPDALEATCARMRSSLAAPLLLGERVIQVTASIGVAVCPEEGTTPDSLYKSADLALYEAKRAGRNAWRWRLAPALGTR